jgi:hypothetical protein
VCLQLRRRPLNPRQDVFSDSRSTPTEARD